MLGLGLSTVAINDQQEIGAGKLASTLETLSSLTCNVF